MLAARRPMALAARKKTMLVVLRRKRAWRKSVWRKRALNVLR